MAYFNIRVERECGEVEAELSDTSRLLTSILHKTPEDTHGLFRYVDPYGNTIFNTLQAPDLIAACECMLKEDLTVEERQFLNRLIELSEQVKERVHRFLIFIGD